MGTWIERRRRRTGKGGSGLGCVGGEFVDILER